jgi:hypothetical protein
MKSFKFFLEESNELVVHGEDSPKEPQKHPMVHFLSFMRDEIPLVDHDDYDSDQMYMEEMHNHITKLLGEDPSHLQELHKSLTTDPETGSRQEADLYDVLYRITSNVANATQARYKKEKRINLSINEISDVMGKTRKHMEERATKLIRSRARQNPNLKHHDLTDVKI